jgi:hypothetical protein
VKDGSRSFLEKKVSFFCVSVRLIVLTSRRQLSASTRLYLAGRVVHLFNRGQSTFVLGIFWSHHFSNSFFLRGPRHKIKNTQQNNKHLLCGAGDNEDNNKLGNKVVMRAGPPNIDSPFYTSFFLCVYNPTTIKRLYWFRKNAISLLKNHFFFVLR